MEIALLNDVTRKTRALLVSLYLEEISDCGADLQILTLWIPAAIQMICGEFINKEYFFDFIVGNLFIHIQPMCL